MITSNGFNLSINFIFKSCLLYNNKRSSSFLLEFMLTKISNWHSSELGAKWFHVFLNNHWVPWLNEIDICSVATIVKLLLNWCQWHFIRLREEWFSMKDWFFMRELIIETIDVAIAFTSWEIITRELSINITTLWLEQVLLITSPTLLCELFSRVKKIAFGSIRINAWNLRFDAHIKCIFAFFSPFIVILICCLNAFLNGSVKEHQPPWRVELRRILILAEGLNIAVAKIIQLQFYFILYNSCIFIFSNFLFFLLILNLITLLTDLLFNRFLYIDMKIMIIKIHLRK